MPGYFVNTVIETTNGNDAYDLPNAGDSLIVGSSGALLALDGGDGINASGFDQNVMLDGLAYAAEGDGVDLSGPGGTEAEDTLTVNGQAEGETGIVTFGADNIITVNGVAEGQDGNGIGIWGGGTALYINGTVEGNSNEASGIAIISGGGGDTFNIGALGQVTGYNGIEISGGDGNDIITNDGHITALGDALFIGSSNVLIQNDGVMSGSEGSIFVEQSTGVTIENAGTIQGTLQVGEFSSDGSSVDIDNMGVWQASGGLVFDGTGANVVTNSGKIHGAISMGGDTGNDTVTNSGTITGAITMGSGADTVVNSGTITGAVSLSGSGSTLTNGGLIHGSVTMGAADTLTNTGTIHGSVVLAANDTVDTSRGEITGTVTASTSDTFNFSGEFGHNVILGFATASTTHDTINFLSDDFSSYTQLQSHMAQVGNDVVITLDSADTIVLEHMTLAHLTTHDFTFG